jgi:hypothetical protein
MFEGLRKPTELIVIVVTLLAFGCPVQRLSRIMLYVDGKSKLANVASNPCKLLGD